MDNDQRIAMLESRLALLEARLAQVEMSRTQYGPIVPTQPFMPQPVFPWTVTCEALKTGAGD